MLARLPMARPRISPLELSNEAFCKSSNSANLALPYAPDVARRTVMQQARTIAAQIAMQGIFTAAKPNSRNVTIQAARLRTPESSEPFFGRFKERCSFMVVYFLSVEMVQVWFSGR